MSRILILITGIVYMVSPFLTAEVLAQNITLTHKAGTAGGASGVSANNLAEIAAANKIATIQVQTGQTLTKAMQELAEGKIDISAGPFVLRFLMSKGLGPYSGIGKEKGKELASNTLLLYPYHIASFFLIAFESNGINSWDKLAGRTIFNGPPRGGALTGARNIIRLTTGLEEGKGYKGKQIAWGQANSLFLDRSVDAAVRPGTIPASYIPIYTAAGKVNVISIPKTKFESKPFKRYLGAPGNVASVFPVRALAVYGDGANIISEDGMFRTVAQTAGDFVNRSMDKKLAKALTAAFIKSIPELQKKVPFAKNTLYGSIDDKNMGICSAQINFHPGAIEAWEEAGHKVPECAKAN